MGKCPYIESCPMFRLFKFETTKMIYRQKYCEEEYMECVRYQMRKSGTKPPPNLLPDGRELKVTVKM